MSYQVLALKYRPQTFDDVVGQKHVTTTLINALTANRVAHAVLFTGPRGTGKTTIARILAKAMNCVEGPTPSPCNVCLACKEITEGHCTDVFEIDGASNNSVDQIREIRENVTYMPSSAKYKIYIIDEVHMLSTAAFNALLKTLEEPPAHVMFIFATTEVNKIPLTILSRCQRHDLARIPLEMLSDHLMKISEKEGFGMQKQSIDLIAREADGSVRDSLSLLDRILSSSPEKEPEHELILNALGVFDHRIMQEISLAIFKNNGRKLIEIIEEINNSGTDLTKFYSDLIVHFRNLSILKICGQNSMAVNLSDFEKKSLLDSCPDIRAEHVQTILQILLEDENLVRYSSHTRTAIEMVMIKLLEPDAGSGIDYIVHQLDKLAKQIVELPAQNETIPAAGNIPGTPREKQSQSINTSISYTIADKENIGNEINAVREQITPLHISGDKTPAENNSVSSDNAAAPLSSGTGHNFLSALENTHRYIFTLISKGTVKEASSDELVIELNNCSKFDKKRIEDKLQELEKICIKSTGKRLLININTGVNTVNTEINTGQANNNIVETEVQNQKNNRQSRQDIINNPLVSKALKMFNAEIV